VYLDHAGATLYSEPQMADVVKDLTSNVYGNPRILGSPSPEETLFSFLLLIHVLRIPVDVVLDMFVR
jgi:hypothetical protein